ncbi:SDR family oxidoreductase [Leptolyngbya sp. GB1-A1]|uniref:SDR family oxidoreductase n=1 Tax=Leptolyngbya sp. GB1-A1 TaxID=2933908 RepID=UPI003297A001
MIHPVESGSNDTHICLVLKRQFYDCPHSNVSNRAFPETSLYVASKHAVMGLTRSAALDYAKQGIRINAINPGPIATDFMARAADQWSIPSDDLGSMVPMGRIGQAMEIAQAVMFLCSDAASYITEQPFAIDSG